VPHDIFHALGLNSNPFSPATSTKGYFHTQATQRILEEIHFGVINRRGFLLLIGEVGVGKTSLLLQLLEQLHKDTNGSLRTAWVFNTVLDRVELLQTIAADFGLTPDSGASFTDLLNQLHEFFLQVTASGGNCAIIVDEAHNLDGQTLESLRLLSNLESDETKLVQILLAGQPELQSRLDQQEFRQLRSRIAISNLLPPLKKNEIKRYIDFKLSSTRSQLALPPKGVALLWKATRGNARLINLIMDRTLHVMYALNESRLSPRIIRLAIKEVAGFQKDIHIRYVLSRRKMAAVAGVLFMCLAVFILLTLYGGPNLIREQKQATADRTTKQGAVVQEVDHGQAQPGDTMQGDKIPQKVVKRFLAPFHVQDLGSFLQQAVQNGSPEILEAKLPDEIQLVGLNALPDEEANMRYAAFPWKNYAGGHPAWIALWEPPVQISSYFPDHESTEIRKVQERLKELGFYDIKADGYVGSKTWRGFSAFQKAYGLKRTGTPTKETLFWLFAGEKPEGR